MLTNSKIIRHQKKLKLIKAELGPQRTKHTELLCKKGSSSWLTSLPLQEFGFVLNKQEFVDALHLRYNFPMKNIPTYCACGEKNSADHALVCKKGGFVSMRHNQIRDLTANMLLEAGCKDVMPEPPLIPLSGETFSLRSTNTSPDARADVCARGVWNTMDKTFLDIRVFHHAAPSNQSASMDDTFKKHEDEKKRQYNKRILEVEKATFTPLVFSTMGGTGIEADKFYKRVASLIAVKRDIPYSVCASYIRRKLSFCLLRTVLIAFRGYRGRPVKKEDPNSDINLIDFAPTYS